MEDDDLLNKTRLTDRVVLQGTLSSSVRETVQVDRCAANWDPQPIWSRPLPQSINSFFARHRSGGPDQRSTIVYEARA